MARQLCVAKEWLFRFTRSGSIKDWYAGISPVGNWKSSRNDGGVLSVREDTVMNWAVEPWLPCSFQVQTQQGILLEILAHDRGSSITANTKSRNCKKGLRKYSNSSTIWLLDKSDILVCQFSGEWVVSNFPQIGCVQMSPLYELRFPHHVHFRLCVQCQKWYVKENIGFALLRTAVGKLFDLTGAPFAVLTIGKNW